MKQSLFKKILYATDLSATAKKAARYAVGLAHDYDAQLTIVNVIPDLLEEMSAGMGYDLATHFSQEKLDSFYVEGLEKNRKMVAKRLDVITKEAASGIENYSVQSEVLIKVGHPVDQIIKTVIEGHYDLVVLGTHGHSMIDDLLLGSVARGVVKKSPVPVLTVRLNK